MGCSHAATCPLFPLLRASLQGWRSYYCDSEDQWLDCARYELSLTGERVPISLLPNGATARHLERAGGAGRPGPAGPGQAARQVPQPQPAPQPEPSGCGTAAPRTTAAFEVPPPSAPVRPGPSSPPLRTTQPPDRPLGHRRRANSPKRGWWARLADWMRNPA
ncbi:hypothetical protein C1I97_06635 [Streptomyces sp. NTH33]|nr:hypothetical protein C1I97_06635 [Streptomyces sp. NTH33]